MKLPVYLDYQATTPMDPAVFEAMRPFFMECFGNPSSRGHAFGWEAEEAVASARTLVARCLGAVADEIVFTSGATESNALALRGVLGTHDASAAHVVTVATEHSSVLETFRALESKGVAVTVVPVAADGTVDPDDVRFAMNDHTVLISVMMANNEIGTIGPVAEIGRMARERGVLFHTDATQAIGNLHVDVRAIGCDLLSLSAHKIHGPKGVGALYIRRRSEGATRLTPLMQGGGQERGLRPGTLNVPGIVGLGTACALVQSRMSIDPPRHRILRDALLDRLRDGIEGVVVHGTLDRRLPSNLNVGFEGVDGDSLFLGLRDLAVSNGSACHSAHRRPSHVLKAIGRSDALALASIRFGVGRFTTSAEVEYAAERVVLAIRRLRGSVARTRG